MTLEFSLSNPGARALGFGGAFAGLADDATAAFANPAGLVQLLRTEVSLEGRRWDYAVPYNEGGRLDGEPSSIGIDTEAGVRSAVSRSHTRDFSFASLVVPKGRWAMAVFTHTLAKFSSLAETQGLFGIGDQVAGTRRYYDSRTSFELEVDGVGIAGAWRLTDQISAGLGLTRYHGTMVSTSEEFLIDTPTVESFFAINHYRPERSVGATVIEFDGADVVVNAGFLWAVAPRINVGGFYRQGPEFPVKARIVAGPSHPYAPAGTALLDDSGHITLPDVFGVGVSYRSADGRLTLAAEWDRVRYSMITHSISRAPALRIDQTIDDASEYRIGGELAFLSTRPIVALRAGAWLDPDHRLRSVDDSALDHFYFQDGSDEMHYALGLGIAFESFQVDIGVDVSKLVDTASLSIIYSF